MPLAMSIGTPSRPQGSRFGHSLPHLRRIIGAGALRTGDEGLLAHVSLNDAGMDRVDTNPIALAREFERCRFSEQRNAALRHRIQRVELRADDAGDRGKVDDGAAMLAGLRRFAQCRSRQFGTEEYAGHVHRDQLVPFIEADLLDPFADEDTGVIDQDVELAEPADRKMDGGGPVLLFRHVKVHIFGLCTFSRDDGNSLASANIEHIANHQLGAGFGDQSRSLSANAACGTGDQSNLAIETVHGWSPLLLLPASLRSSSSRGKSQL